MDLESSALLSPPVRSRADSILSEASEPPYFSAEEAEDLLNRGSLSTKMLRGMFKGDRASRSPSRSRSPNKQRGDARSPSLFKAVDGERDNENFEIGAESDTERES
jgi:hypothetical protein